MNTDIIFEIILNFSFQKLLIHDPQAKYWDFYFYFANRHASFVVYAFKRISNLNPFNVI